MKFYLHTREYFTMLTYSPVFASELEAEHGSLETLVSDLKTEIHNEMYVVRLLQTQYLNFNTTSHHF